MCALPSHYNARNPSPEQVRAHLAEIQASKAFAMSRRSCEFLTFVVEEVLCGREEELKERTIGVAVFGRSLTYDTSQDAIVRINASEIRKRLTMFYGECAKPVPLRIVLPAGGYVPRFIHPESENSSFDAEGPYLEQDIAHASPDPSSIFSRLSAEPGFSKTRWPSFARFHRSIFVLVAILISAMAYSGVRWVWIQTHPTLLKQFWGPVVQARQPIYLVTSSVPAYVAYKVDRVGTAGSVVNKAVTEPEDRYVLTSDQFIGRGDMLADERIKVLLQNLGHAGQIKTSGAVDLREMASCSVVLIGYASTAWAAMSRNLRYLVNDDNVGMITDFGKPTAWYPHHLTEDLHTDDDFALVARVYLPETRSVVVLVSGATQYGTEAAADLVTDSEMLSEALKGRPKDWSGKNIEIVLHTKVIGNTPATPDIVAVDYR